jgi:hypothetical protein
MPSANAATVGVWSRSGGAVPKSGHVERQDVVRAGQDR